MNWKLLVFMQPLFITLLVCLTVVSPLILVGWIVARFAATDRSVKVKVKNKFKDRTLKDLVNKGFEKPEKLK